MRKLEIGNGDAVTEIPDDWESSVNENSTIVTNPPGQDTAFLWLSTVSWEMPANPNFNPADDFFRRPEAKLVIRIEQLGETVVAYTVKQTFKDGVAFKSHQFRVLPTRPAGGFALVAFLTLSVRCDDGLEDFVQHVLEDTWEIARKIRFNFKPAA